MTSLASLKSSLDLGLSLIASCMRFLAFSALPISSISYLAAAIQREAFVTCTCSIRRKVRPITSFHLWKIAYHTIRTEAHQNNLLYSRHIVEWAASPTWVHTKVHSPFAWGSRCGRAKLWHPTGSGARGSCKASWSFSPRRSRSPPSCVNSRSSKMWRRQKGYYIESRKYKKKTSQTSFCNKREHSETGDRQLLSERKS